MTVPCATRASTSATPISTRIRPSGKLLGPLDLVQILGGIVVNRGPEQAAQILRTGRGGRRGMGLNGGQFRVGSGGEIRLETVLDHGGVGGGDEIEVNWLAGMHRESGSLKLKSQPTMPGWRAGDEWNEEQTQVPFELAQGRPSTPLRSA